MDQFLIVPIKFEQELNVEPIKLESNNNNTFQGDLIIKTESIFNEFGYFNSLCEDCGLRFPSEEPLLQHRTINHKSPKSEQFECEQCPFKAPFRSDLNSHIYFDHPLEIKLHTVKIPTIIHPKKADVPPEDPLKVKAKNWIRCGHCTYQTLYPDKIYQHWEQIHRKSQKKHTVDKWNKCKCCLGGVFKCEACPYVSHCYKKLLIHKTEHPAKKVMWYKCGLCNFRSQAEIKVNEHLLQIHKVLNFAE